MDTIHTNIAGQSDQLKNQIFDSLWLSLHKGLCSDITLIVRVDQKMILIKLYYWKLVHVLVFDSDSVVEHQSTESLGFQVQFCKLYHNNHLFSITVTVHVLIPNSCYCNIT